MATDGVDAVFIETHNWGAMARFFRSLGYTLEFETDHNSGQFRNKTGPSVFIAEVPPDRPTAMKLVLAVGDANSTDLPPDVDVVSEFETTHYGTREMTVRDPDGRVWSLQSPVAS